MRDPSECVEAGRAVVTDNLIHTHNASQDTYNAVCPNRPNGPVGGGRRSAPGSTGAVPCRDQAEHCVVHL